MTDAEIIEHFRLYSTDPDDRELVLAWDALQRLKAQRDLSPLKTELVEKLSKAIEVCMHFLRQETAYRISHPRPVLYPWRGPAYWRRLSTTKNNERTNE
jgi:hypothetical protein